MAAISPSDNDTSAKLLQSSPFSTEIDDHFSSVHSSNTIYTIGAIAEEADKVLFKKVMSANHCFISSLLHFLLPSVKSSGYCLGHPYQFPRCEYEMNYIKSLLFLDVCIEIVTVKQSALSLFAFMCVHVSIFLCAFFSFS